jgi:hypothetical protein
MRVRWGRAGRSMILLGSWNLGLEEVTWRRSWAMVLLLSAGGLWIYTELIDGKWSSCSSIVCCLPIVRCLSC